MDCIFAGFTHVRNERVFKTKERNLILPYHRNKGEQRTIQDVYISERERKGAQSYDSI